MKSRQKAEDAGDIHFSNIFLTLDELKTGAVQRVTYHHYGDRSTAFLQIRITRCEQNPAQPGNLLMDFEFRAPDESIDVQNVSWNQRDFVALARGSDWSASLTAQREELAK